MYWQSAASVKAHGDWAASHYLNMKWWKMLRKEIIKSVYHLFVPETLYVSLIWCDCHLHWSLVRSGTCKPLMPKLLRVVDMSWFPTPQLWESWWWHLQCGTSTSCSLHLYKFPTWSQNTFSSKSSSEVWRTWHFNVSIQRCSMVTVFTSSA